jgi:microcystin-dependent protein
MAGYIGSKASVTQVDGYTRAEADPRFVPSGAVFMFAADAAPTGYLKANGATISRTTYATLFAVIGTTFGAGDGSTTFQLPDLRGEFLRGWDDSRGADTSRVFGSAQGFGIPRLFGGVADSHGNAAMTAAPVSGYTNPFYGSGSSLYRSDLQVNTTNYAKVYFDSNRVIPSTADVRPRNVALLACIKY